MPSRFDIVIGVDMETDIGSFTDYYNGVQKGTPRLLEMFSRHGVQATFFWTGHAAENTPRWFGGAFSGTNRLPLLYHKPGDPFVPLPNIGRLRLRGRGAHPAG